MNWLRDESGDYRSGDYVITEQRTINGRRRIGWALILNGETLATSRLLDSLKRRADEHASRAPVGDVPPPPEPPPRKLPGIPNTARMVWHHDVREEPFTVSGPAGIISLPATFPPNAPAHPRLRPSHGITDVVDGKGLVLATFPTRELADAVTRAREHTLNRAAFNAPPALVLDNFLAALARVLAGETLP